MMPLSYDCSAGLPIALRGSFAMGFLRAHRPLHGLFLRHRRSSNTSAYSLTSLVGARRFSHVWPSFEWRQADDSGTRGGKFMRCAEASNSLPTLAFLDDAQLTRSLTCNGVSSSFYLMLLQAVFLNESVQGSAANS